MNEIENQTEAEVAAEVDPIETIYQGECPSLSGRSTLSYTIGRHTEDETLHLRISDNSGKGMWCKDWCSASAIQEVVLGEGELTAKSLQVLYLGKSVNTGGFLAAVLKDLGLIRANEENTRLHEHAPTTTFEQVAMARIDVSSTPKPGRQRKGRVD